MGEHQIQHPFSLPPPPMPPLPPPLPPLPPPASPRDDSAPPEPSSLDDPSPPSAPPFDPSQMIGIIKRKAMIKELAAAYHAECLEHCQELLELQKKNDEASNFHNARNISCYFLRSVLFSLRIHSVSMLLWMSIYGECRYSHQQTKLFQVL